MRWAFPQFMRVKRPGAVARSARRHRLRPEFLFVADLVDEVDLENPAVGVALPVEDVGLQEPPAFRRNRGTKPQARNPRIDRGPQPLDFNGVDAAYGRVRLAPGRERRDVERGEPERAAQRLSVNDAARQRITAAQHHFGFVEVARGQRTAHARRTHAGVRVVERGRDGGLKMQFLPHAFKKRNVALTVAPEPEVFPHRDPLGVKTFNEDLPHEVLGRHRGQVRVEGEHVDALDPAGEHGLHLVPKRRDAGRRHPEALARVRFKGHHGGEKTARRGRFRHALKERLMPRVHAVEVADGERRRAALKGVEQTSENVHGVRAGKVDRTKPAL